jgi:nucleoid DNA-binding protein
MFIITNQKIPIEIFNTYLTDLASNKYNEIKKKLMKYRQSYYHNLDIIDKFPYGMDEYYSNNIIYNYLYTKKTWVIYDINPILLIKKIKNNTELIKMMYDLCNDLYKTNDQQIIKNMINTIKSLIRKVGEVTLLNYFESFSKEQTSLKYIIDLLMEENINTNSFDQMKHIK